MSLYLAKKFDEVSMFLELEVSWLCWSEKNQVLETDGDNLFKDFLTNEIFSKQVLS